MTAEPAPNGARLPTRPEEVRTGREMDFPYPSRALAISFLTLAAVPAAVGCSRQLVRLGLNRWGLARMAGDAELVVSELATNAVQATGVMGTDAKWQRTWGTSRPFTYGCCCSRRASSSRSGTATGQRQYRRK